MILEYIAKNQLVESQKQLIKNSAQYCNTRKQLYETRKQLIELSTQHNSVQQQLLTYKKQLTKNKLGIQIN